MEDDRADERWLAPPDPARARWRSPHARQTKDSARLEVLTTVTNVLAACRLPSGTNVLRPTATPRRRPQHPHSSVPRQSRSRTLYNSLARPPEVGLTIAGLLAHPDPNADCISSSQPPLMECCDDRLKPPSIPETAVLEPRRRGVLDAPLEAGHDIRECGNGDALLHSRKCAPACFTASATSHRPWRTRRPSAWRDPFRSGGRSCGRARRPARN